MGPIWTLLMLAAELPLLRWMSGDWRCESKSQKGAGPTYVDEHWLQNERGELVGVGRTHQLKTLFMEHMKITRGPDGRWRLHASPNGAEPVLFPEVRSGASEILFENGANDYPQRVHYRRDGEALVGTISRLDGSRKVSWRYVRLRGSDDRWPACSGSGN